jgi:zinc transport system substrate-binding protein
MPPVPQLLVAVVMLAFGTGCGAEEGNDNRSVVTAFYPLAWVAEEIAGEDVEVVNLTPPGAEPHDIELTARDVERVQDAEVVLYLGRGFMPALEDAVQGHSGAIDLLAGQKLLAGRDEHGHEEEKKEEDDGEALELDPHVWLDPARLAAIAGTVAEALGEPTAAGELVARLEGLDRELREGLLSCERREVVTSHAAFGYLADAYGLRQIALTGISPEAEPSPRALEALIGEVQEEGATTVFFETLVSPRLAETVARETGARTVALNPLEGLTEDELAAGADYFSVMRDNLGVLREALGCR